MVGGALTVAYAQPAVQLEVKFSKPLAVFHYVRQLTPKARTNPYKAQFEASRFATAANLARLDAFGAIRTDYEYSYPDYPDGKIEGSTSYILKRNVLLASSLADFRARSIALLPSGDVSESELPSDMKNYPAMLALMLHEAAHIRLDEHQRDAARVMERWYAESQATTRQYAKGLMQESWATDRSGSS